MPLHYSPVYFLHYLFKRKATQFFTSIAIRYLAMGMVLIFEPVYIFIYFRRSLPLTLLFFAIIYGVYGLIVVYGGKLMAKIGLRQCMLLSHFFFFGYYLSLFFLYRSFWLVFLSITLRIAGMAFFWPPFHTDFVRFSEKDHQGTEVGKLNIVQIIPAIVSPVIGGIILNSFGYQVLFVTVLCVLLASAIPLFLSQEVHEIYSDSYEKAWQRIFKKENRGISLSFVAGGLEMGINIYLWPIFMFVLAINYNEMGGVTSLALAVSALFALYMGKLSDKLNKLKLLNIGSILTSISWIIKYFVNSVFSAFLAQSIYRICRTTAGIPFQTLLYGKAALKGEEADEFIIYREIVWNLSRAFLFMFLAGIFFVIPKVNISFIIAAVVSLGFTFFGKAPNLKLEPKK